MPIAAYLFVFLFALLPGSSRAQQEIQFWHAMGGPLGAELDALVQRFNDSQKDFRVVAAHKGSYEDVMTGALAAQRAGSGPHLVQVYEVGTAHMMAAKSAVRLMSQVLTENGESASTTALAAKLKVSAPSVTGMIQKLATSKPALVEYQKHQGATLTKDGKKAALEVKDYQAAISWSAQTALRDIIGRMMLADILVGRTAIDEELQRIIDIDSPEAA